MRDLRCDAAAGLEHHQVLCRNANAHFCAWQVVGMARENRLQLAAGRQLQAVQGRGAEEGLADNPRFQVAVGRVDDIVRTQQYINRAARWPDIRPIAA